MINSEDIKVVYLIKKEKLEDQLFKNLVYYIREIISQIVLNKLLNMELLTHRWQKVLRISIKIKENQELKNSHGLNYKYNMIFSILLKEELVGLLLN